MKKIMTISSALLLCLNFSCKENSVKPSPAANNPEAKINAHFATDASTSFANGSDVSWVTQMEASGLKFFNTSGTQQDLFTILGGLGINSIRLRVWVNPSGGWCNTADLVAKAKRAKSAGMNIMIDFHYSDTWADPGDQNKPAAWTSFSTATLISTVNSYTTSTLNTLKSNGITPVWVQVGNETSNGMLWNDGKASLSSTDFQNFANMITSGYNAVKAVFPSAKVIVHLANGYDNTVFRWMFDGLKTYGAKYDVIGMSLYPTTSNWSTLNSECLTNMNDMVSRYGKQVMICEAGMSESAASTCKSFLSDLITKVKSVSGGNGLGVFYWEPEAYNNWQGYTNGAFDPTGKPTVALTAF
jgi:arabinogalactan endo-1,4-beta-galactosidase